MKAILALAVKDLRLLFRDKTGFFFTFFFPLLIAVFFGTIFSGDGGGSAISMVIVDEDHSVKSEEFVTQLDSAKELRVEMASRSEAVQKVRRGKSTAYLVLKKGFGEARNNVFYGSTPEVELGVDPSRKAEAGMLQGILMKYAVKDFQKMFSDKNLMQKNARQALQSVQKDTAMAPAFKQDLQRFLGELDKFLDTEDTEGASREENGFSGFEPLKITQQNIVVQRRGPNNPYALSFPQGIIWGILGTTIAFGVSLVVERKRGTLVRLQIAPLRRAQILGGKALACFITIISIYIVLFAIAVFIFGVRPNSYLLTGLAVFSSAIGFVGIMMFLSVLGKTEQAASGIGWAVMMVMAMIGGAMIPLFVMPSWLQKISNLSPIKWALLAVEGGIWRQFTLQEMLLPCAILVSIGIAFFWVGVRAFRWMD